MNTWFWEKITISGSSLPTSREGHSFLYDSSTHNWILFGGVGTSRINEALLLDTSSRQWKQISKSKPPLERAYHISWIDSESNKMYIFGGQGSKREPMYDMHALSINIGKWIKLGPSERPAGRIHSAGCILNSNLYLFGGASAPYDMLNNDLWAFSYKEINWTIAEKEGHCPGWIELKTNTPPYKRKGHTMLANNSTIYIFGGFNGTEYFNDLCCISPPNLTWYYPHTFGQSPSPRAFHSSTVTSSSKMVIFGGKGLMQKNNTELLYDVYILDLKDLYWSSPFIAGFYPSSRQGAGMSWGINASSSEQILIIGGIGKGYSGMDLFNLKEREIDSNTQWHLEDIGSGQLKYQASTESTLLSNRKKIRDLEGRIYMLQEKGSFLEDDIITLKGKLEKEEHEKNKMKTDFKSISRKVKSEMKTNQKQVRKNEIISGLIERKISVYQNRIERLSSTLKEIETFLVIMDSAFYDTISLNNISSEFLNFTKSRMDEISERKKSHQLALAILKDWYEKNIAYEDELFSLSNHK